jgi:SAM-dependent methyltransferase
MTVPAAGDRWYETAFGPLTAAFWTALIPAQRVLDEARFLAAALGAPAGGLLLDVPCGAGRQARALAALGFAVEGLDVSPHMLAACPDPLPAGVTLRQGDMLALDAERRYDGAYCWGNSFGYLSDDGSRAFFSRVARALKPGARFALESGAVAENLLPSLEPQSEIRAAGFRFSARRSYDLAGSALHIRYRIERGAEVEEFSARQAIYTTGEVVRMAAAAGLALESLHGGIAGEPPAIGRPMIALLRRSAT